MATTKHTPEELQPRCDRRSFLAAALGGTALVPAFAQQRQPAPVSLVPTPRDWSKNDPIGTPDSRDPDLVVLDERFRRYTTTSQIRRLYTGALFSEGPAWNGQGRYVVWSDIPGNVQMRYDEDGHVMVFRNPSGYSNGNTFDFEGRQLSCEHGGRRVVRYEHTGAVTVIAEKFEGKRLNSPNDIVVHPDGGIWFSDPTGGIRATGEYFQGFKAEPELKPAIYRVDGKTLQIEKATDEIQPNGMCFSPDYKKIYCTNGATGITVFDLDGKSLRNGKTFTKLTVPGGGEPTGADGIRCDIDGAIWAGARPGVQIIASNGELIGMIRAPERCANICFGGARRNRLFMAASQSLYALYVNTMGAHIA